MVTITIRSDYFGTNWLTVKRGRLQLTSEYYSNYSNTKRAAEKWREAFADATIVEKRYGID